MYIIGKKNVIIPVVIFLVAFIIRILYFCEISKKEIIFDLRADSIIYNNYASPVINDNILGNNLFLVSPEYSYFVAGLYSIFFLINTITH